MLNMESFAAQDINIIPGTETRGGLATQLVSGGCEFEEEVVVVVFARENRGGSAQHTGGERSLRSLVFVVYMRLSVRVP